MKIQKKIIQLFIDLRFAIFLLVLIGAVSALGSIIEQDQSDEYYMQSYPLIHPVGGILTYQFIFGLGLNHIYRSWFFLGLLFFLMCSLILCTSKQQFPNVNVARALVFVKKGNAFKSLPFFSKLPYSSLPSAKIITFLQNTEFYIHQQKNSFYALNGLFGKIGPILVHISLTLILVGGIFGAFGRFSAEEFLPRGEITHIQNLFVSGWFTSLPKFAIRLNDFWIEYANQKISQFYSNLSILDSQGEEKLNSTIFVNHPLFYQDVSIYQVDWDLLGLRIQQNLEKIQQYPLFLIQKQPKVWSSVIVDDSQTAFFVLLEELRQTLKVYNLDGQFVANLNFGQKFSQNMQSYFFVDVIPETGLQVKADPSIPLTFLGFGLLMVSTLISYLTYSEFWLYFHKKHIFIGGRTARSQVDFEKQFSKIVQLFS